MPMLHWPLNIAVSCNVCKNLSNGAYDEDFIYHRKIYPFLEICIFSKMNQIFQFFGNDRWRHYAVPNKYLKPLIFFDNTIRFLKQKTETDRYLHIESFQGQREVRRRWPKRFFFHQQLPGADRAATAAAANNCSSHFSRRRPDSSIHHYLSSNAQPPSQSSPVTTSTTCNNPRRRKGHPTGTSVNSAVTYFRSWA